MKIAVIGGGIAGCAGALALARAGYEVEILEKNVLGGGASGLALGGLFPYTARVRTRLAGVQRGSVAAWDGFAAQLSDSSGWKQEDFYRSWGEVKQVRVEVLFEVLRAALGRAGVGVKERFGEVEGGDWRGLKEEYGGIVVAAGWETARLAGWRVDAVEGQALKLAWDGVVGPVYGEDIYVLPGWRKGEVLVGSSRLRLEAPREAVVRDGVTADLLARAERLVEGLGQARVLEAWVGHRPTLPRGAPMLPLVRGLERGVWAVAPLGGMGLCLAPALGRAVVAAVGGV